MSGERKRVAAPKATVARTVGALSRHLGRGGGTSLPGKVLLKMQADAVDRMAAALTGGSVVISATNGKTTTATMLAGILRENGVELVHNSAGANMPGGIATALLDSGARVGETEALGLFEVDEAWLGAITAAVRPRVLVLANLFRDQLDRYGELEKLADTWRAAIADLPDETVVVLNADDPLVASLGDDRESVLYFGIDDDRNVEPAMRHAADSKDCRRCGGVLVYESVQLGHLGQWRCASCGYERPQPQVTATKIVLAGMGSTKLECATPAGTVKLHLPLPGLYNAYNALAAIAAATALGVSTGKIAAGLSAVQSAFGRVETIDVDGLAVPLLLIKNPTGANEVLRTIADGEQRFDLWVALNDGIADGRDVSWIWDADFDCILARVRRVVCSGHRADEMALRMAYAGVDRNAIHVDPRIYQSFSDAAHTAQEEGVEMRALPTYTSLLELRTGLAANGYAGDYWNGAA